MEPQNTINNQQRIPRPSGTTLMAQQAKLSTINAYHTNKTQLTEKLRNHILNHYISNGFTICGKQHSITQLAALLNISTQSVLREISKTGQRISGIVGSTDPDQLLKQLLGLLVETVISDRQATFQQYRILYDNQGDRYVPYLTTNLNKAIENLMLSTKPFMELVKLLSGVGQQRIIIENEAQSAGKSLTAEEAIAIIEQEALNAPKDSHQAQLQVTERHNLNEAPELDGRKQMDGPRVDASDPALNP